MFEQIEKALLNRGHINSAFTVWNFAATFESLYRSGKKQEDWLSVLADHIYRGMSLKQLEIEHIQTLQALEKLEKVDGGLTAEDRDVLELCRQRCSRFERMWWRQNRDYYGYLYNKPKGGGLGRMLDLLSNEALRGHEAFPEVAKSFHRDARSACKAVGGCCIYDCGCCSRERVPGEMMHCTSGCECCMARKGLTLKDLKHDRLPSDEEARQEIACTYLIVVGQEGVTSKC